MSTTNTPTKQNCFGRPHQPARYHTQPASNPTSELPHITSKLAPRATVHHLQDKTTYGRLRVLTAPPTSVHELGNAAAAVNGAASESASPRDQMADNVGGGAGSPFSFDQSGHQVPGGHQLQHSQSQSNYGTAHQKSCGAASSAAESTPRRHQHNQQANSLSGGVASSVGGTGSNRRSGGGSTVSAAGTTLRPASSATGSTQRLSSGGGGGGSSAANRDHSVTQFALIDDDNVSAMQQMTRGGGALTMASQWKSQFDDSEETTDNEWKQEPQSPSHHCGPASHPNQLISSHHAHQHLRHGSAGAATGGISCKRSVVPGMEPHTGLPAQSTEMDMAAAAAAAVRKRAHLNIAGIENYEHLQDVLPHCWSEPALGNVLRDQLEPPVLQQAAFDDTVSKLIYLLYF